MLHVLDRHAIGQILRTKEVDAWGVAANDPEAPSGAGLPHGHLRPHAAGSTGRARAAPWTHAGLPAGVPAREHRARRRHGHAGRRAQGARPRRRARAGRRWTKTNGDQPFPHKTAATQSGLGWIGKTALFISPEFGPAVRLATVFTDLALPAGEPVVESRCGDCRDCVDACPAGCGRDVLWRPGMARELLFDAGACRHHMTLFTGVEADICGICIAACPYANQY